MTETARALYLAAARAAMRLRKSFDLGISPCCPFDLAERMGIDVRYSDEIGGLEGLYLFGDPPAILVAAERPAGRQAYTCAHEIGHHVFGDGDVIDDVVGASSVRRYSPREYRADLFAGQLMMPRAALEMFLKRRNLLEAALEPEQAYAAANWFGVGYETVVIQLQSLALISAANASRLSKARPKAIRSSLLGISYAGELVCFDENWNDRPIDVAVGDAILAPFCFVFDGPHQQVMARLDWHLAVSPTEPGVFRLSSSDPDWSGFARVRPKEFKGRAIYRHLPMEADDE